MELGWSHTQMLPTQEIEVEHTPEVFLYHSSLSFLGSLSDYESNLDDDESDDECEVNEMPELDHDEEFGLKLADLAAKDDPNDKDWIPLRLRRKPYEQQEHPKTYIKGPDVMSKSKRTQQQYQKHWKNQATLDIFLNPPASLSASSILQSHRASERDDQSDESITSVHSQDQSAISASMLSSGSEDDIEMLETEPELANSASSTQDPVSADNNANPLIAAVTSEIEREDEETVLEDWEYELDLGIQGNSQLEDIQDWGVLQTQMKADLAKYHNQLPLSQMNKLMILINFATFCLKGISWIQASEQIALQWHEKEGVWFAHHVCALAHHYQIFEQLPAEHCGGYKNSHSLLHDENVKKASLNYQANLPTGKVTPKSFQDALNTKILPDLGITTK
ncbi:hypothetical protein BDQ12DRAFT_669907 [Crucibulum laeve]|uniref:Uncharacterized protein n=1 Tax=Crucibulum laeve TaxID=68775 RepID=A0A5C3LM16_9AGAR|nr:hypothetical protein BDQ12DRAFT_669907 [Crucibulum laeve]